MSLLLYDPKSRMALGTTPFFPDEEEARSRPPLTEYRTLEENQTYFIRFYGDQFPDFFSRFKQNVPFYREFPRRLYEISFRNAVGLTRLGPFQLQIRNKKVSEQVYQAMLDYLVGKVAELVFSFKKITGQSFVKGAPGSSVMYIEYLFMKKYLMSKPEDLAAIASLITANPHYRLLTEREQASPDQVAQFDAATMLDLITSGKFARLEGRHPLLGTSLGQRLHQRAGKGFFPSEIQVERKYHTVDTHENRFLKFFLRDLIKRLGALLSHMSWTNGSYLSPDIHKHAKSMVEGIETFLSAPFWNDVGPMTFIPVNSQVLQRRDGYRHLFRLYSLLQLATKCDFRFIDFDQLLEIKDSSTLFEYWCFFIVRDLVERRRKAVNWNTLFDEQAWERSLGTSLTIEYEDGVTLSFNKPLTGANGFHPCRPPEKPMDRLDSYSFAYRPDIVIRWKGKRLIMDAKYKGQSSRFYGEDDQGLIGRPQPDDIGKMHTYREAIREASGAYILYPGTDSFCFSAHQARRPFEGVGALALRPRIDGGPEKEHMENLAVVLDDFLNS